jgi:hypothetical protein
MRLVSIHRYSILSSDDILPLSQPPASLAAAPSPPERNRSSAKAMSVVPDSTEPSGSLTRHLYKTFRSSFKPFSSGKKMNHTQSTPDLSSLVENNKNDDDASSSSLENLSNNYSSIALPEQRPTGSILKRQVQTAQPASVSASTTLKSNEEPIYVSSVSVPFQPSSMRSIPSIVRDQNTMNSER